MKTDYYLDGKTAVLGNTLIRLVDERENVLVLSRFGSHRVNTLGSGSLVLPRAREVTLSPDYEILQAECLSCDNQLETLRLPVSVRKVEGNLQNENSGGTLRRILLDRRVSQAFWEEVRRQAIPILQEGWLLPQSIKREALEPAAALIGSLAPAPSALDPRMRLLFTESANNPRPFSRETIFNTRPCLDFRCRVSEQEEYSEVMAMMEEGDPGWHVPSAEAASDMMIRKGADPADTLPQISLICAEKKEDSPQDRPVIRLHMFRTRAFFPALRRIRHDGMDFWLYSRNYLSPWPERLYLRREMGIFSREGLVTDSQVAEEVYAKYRFLCLL